MGEQQVHVVIVYGYDPEKKGIVVKVPKVCSAKADAIRFISLNKVPGDVTTKWEIHTTIAELRTNFSFSTDIPPNYK